jgi:hypothetical protein
MATIAEKIFMSLFRDNRFQPFALTWKNVSFFASSHYVDYFGFAWRFVASWCAALPGLVGRDFDGVYLLLKAYQMSRPIIHSISTT